MYRFLWVIRLFAIIGLCIGLFCGVLYAVGGLLIDVLVSLEFLSPERMGTPGLSYGTILAFGAVVGMPLIFGMGGAILGSCVAGLLQVFLWR